MESCSPVWLQSSTSQLPHCRSQGALFCGGSARMVEAALGIEGDDILYVGDHIYTDAALAKINFRWRTALIVSPFIQSLAEPVMRLQEEVQPYRAYHGAQRKYV